MSYRVCRHCAHMFTALGAMGTAHTQHRICAGRQGARVSVSGHRLAKAATGAPPEHRGSPRRTIPRARAPFARAGGEHRGRLDNSLGLEKVEGGYSQEPRASMENCGSEQRRDLLGRPQDLICSGPARPQLQRDDQTLQLPFLRRQLNASILWPGIPAKYPFSPNLHQTSQLFAGVAFAAISGASSSSTSCLFCVIQIERKECLKALS